MKTKTLALLATFLLALLVRPLAAQSPVVALTNATGNWTPQKSNTTASLHGLSVVNASVVWASGTGGTFVRTTDGGETWRAGTVSGGDKLDFRDVYAVDAKTAYLGCNNGCREDFQGQKDLCLGRDHACVENCRAGRDACREPVENDLDAAVASCNVTKTAAVNQRKADHPDGSQEREDCITAALVVAFQCRDQAREDAKPRLEACRAGFTACAEACPAN